MSVDKKALPVVTERKPPNSGRKKLPQKALAFFEDSARVGIVQITAHAVQFLEGPPPGGFSLSRSLDFLQTVVNKEGPDPESDWPSQSLPDSLSLGKRDTTFRLFEPNNTT